MNKETLYRKALEKYGEKNQRMKCAEECSELIRACLRIDMDICLEESTENFIEELADVQIMVEQMITMYDIYKAVEKVKRLKLKRLEARING